MTARDRPLRDDVSGLFVGKKLSCNGIHSLVCMSDFQAETSDIAFSRLLLTVSIMAMARPTTASIVRQRVSFPLFISNRLRVTVGSESCPIGACM